MLQKKPDFENFLEEVLLDRQKARIWIDQLDHRAIMWYTDAFKANNGIAIGFYEPKYIYLLIYPHHWEYLLHEFLVLHFFVKERLQRKVFISMDSQNVLKVIWPRIKNHLGAS